MLNKYHDPLKMIKSDHAIVLIKTLQWLSISLKEKAKVLTMAHKAPLPEASLNNSSSLAHHTTATLLLARHCKHIPRGLFSLCPKPSSPGIHTANYLNSLSILKYLLPKGYPDHTQPSSFLLPQQTPFRPLTCFALFSSHNT